MGNAHAQVSAYGVFPAADGPIILSPANDGLFGKLLHMLGRDDLLGDARFASNEARLANRAALDTMIAAETAKHPRDWQLDQCHAHGIPAGPIHQIDQVFADPQVIARGMKLDLGGLPTVRSPFTFSDAELAQIGRASCRERVCQYV